MASPPERSIDTRNVKGEPLLATTHIGVSHVGTIPSVTTRDRDSRHRAVRDATTAQVAVTVAQDSVRAAKVTAVLVKRCRTVLTERCRYITK